VFRYNSDMKSRNEIIEELKSIKQELHDKFSVDKLGLFGSYANNEANEDSDLDVLIEFMGEKNDIYRIKKEIKAFLEGKFGMKVDLAREKYLKPYFKEEILKQVIYV